jgi:hypothetical protein
VPTTDIRRRFDGRVVDDMFERKTTEKVGVLKVRGKYFSFGRSGQPKRRGRGVRHLCRKEIQRKRGNNISGKAVLYCHSIMQKPVAARGIFCKYDLADQRPVTMT